MHVVINNNINNNNNNNNNNINYNALFVTFLQIGTSFMLKTSQPQQQKSSKKGLIIDNTALKHE